MSELVSVTLPIFLMVAVGYGAARMRFVEPSFVRGMGWFVLNIALPALVLRALLSQDVAQTLSWRFILAYAAASLGVFVFTYCAARFVLRRDVSRAAMAALGGTNSNSGFVGYPVASLALGASAAIVLPMTILVENVLVVPLALGLAASGREGGKATPSVLKEALLRVVKMPLVISVVVGVVLSAAGVVLPTPLTTTISLFANASTASALFAVGGALAAVTATDVNSDIALIAIAKLVVHPLLTLLCFILVGDIPPALVAAGLVFAAAPMFTVYPLFAERFGLGRIAAIALLVTTAASFVTLTLVLALV